MSECQVGGIRSQGHTTISWHDQVDQELELGYAKCWNNRKVCINVNKARSVCQNNKVVVHFTPPEKLHHGGSLVSKFYLKFLKYNVYFNTCNVIFRFLLTPAKPE